MSAVAVRHVELPCGSSRPGDPDRVVMRTYVLERWRGLMVHHTPIEGDGDQRTFSHLWFTVSHIQSGLAVLKFIEGIANADMVADSLAELGDWTRTTKEIYADEEFCNGVRLKLFAFECAGVGQRCVDPVPAGAPR